MPTYISPQGLEKIKEELLTRTKETRFIIAGHISDAKELGDLSENFEYHEAKERQGLNEARIIELESMVHDAVIVEETTGNDEIGLGVTFEAEVEGIKKTFTMVGSSESNPIEGKISNESPIGMAFIGHKVDDEIHIEVPLGSIKYKITSIK